MQISISQEEQIVLQELKQDLIRIKQELIEWSIGLLIILKNSVIQFILSYDEFALSNIRNKGLVNILSDRALRFFKLDHNEIEERKEVYQKPKKKTIKQYILKTIRVFFFPVYILICIILILFNKNQKKNVINKYET